MSQELPFKPLPLLSDPHRQTIMGCCFNFMPEPKSVTRLVKMPDGDLLAAEVTTPSGWKKTDPTILFVHGLCGSHQSPYLIRLVNKLEPKGIRSVRFNMRNCGSGRLIAKNTYHAGRTEDLFEVLKLLKVENPESPIVLVGFSLGANLALKLSGELGSLARRYLKGVIAICPPVDLFSTVKMIGTPQNRMYEKYFCKLLRKDVYAIHDKYKDLPKVNLPADMKMYEFDHLYVVPTFGFRDPIDYYDKCSSAHVVEDIDVPCRILLSKDDPLISHESLDGYDLPSHVELFKTNQGGHMGYLSSPTSERGFYWLDSVVIEWILVTLK